MHADLIDSANITPFSSVNCSCCGVKTRRRWNEEELDVVGNRPGSGSNSLAGLQTGVQMQMEAPVRTRALLVESTDHAPYFCTKEQSCLTARFNDSSNLSRPFDQLTYLDRTTTAHHGHVADPYARKVWWCASDKGGDFGIARTSEEDLGAC